MNRFALSLLAVFAIATTGWSDLIYDADFDVDNDVAFVHSNSAPPAAGPQSLSGPNWTISYDVTPGTDSGGNSFGVFAGTDLLSSRDFGGAARFASSAVDVSDWLTVDLAGVGETVGGSVFNSMGVESFSWFYALDGAETEFFTTTSDGSLSASVSELDVSGASSLVVGFDFNINGGGDGFDISSVTVEGVSAVPDPSTLCLACFGGMGAFGSYRLRRKKAAAAK